jgi:hypothetical protein
MVSGSGESSESLLVNAVLSPEPAACYSAIPIFAEKTYTTVEDLNSPGPISQARQLRAKGFKIGQPVAKGIGNEDSTPPGRIQMDHWGLGWDKLLPASVGPEVESVRPAVERVVVVGRPSTNECSPPFLVWPARYFRKLGRRGLP